MTNCKQYNPVSAFWASSVQCLGCFSKPRWRRRREHHQTKGLMRRTMVPHVRYYTLNVWSRGKQLVLFSRESWCFPRWSRGKHQDLREKKTNWFPEGPYIKCFVIYLDFPLNNHIEKNKQRRRAGNNCSIVSRSGYIWILSGARDQESTNHSVHFVEWKSSYITKFFVHFFAFVYKRSHWNNNVK